MEERKKALYGSIGAAIFLHIVIVGFFSIKAAMLLNVVIAIALFGVLWKSTKGRRIQLFAALGIAIIFEALAWGVAFYQQLGATQEEQKLVRFQAPPPIMEKNFDLANPAAQTALTNLCDALPTFPCTALGCSGGFGTLVRPNSTKCCEYKGER